MRAVILSGAEADLKELRRYPIKSFDRSTWQRTYRKIQDSIRTLRSFPQRGSIPEELVDLSLQQYRQIISGMNRIVYEVRDDVICIHIICDTRRDMRTVLSRRLLRVIE